MKKQKKPIVGAGGGGGGGQASPVEQADSLQSSSYAQVLDLVSEGEIEGLVNGAQSIFLNETPLQNPDGSFNFQDVVVDTRKGSQGQTYIEGQSSVQNELTVGVEARVLSPVVRTITNENVNAVRVLLSFPQLTYQNPTNGDLSGVIIDYAIDVQSNGAGFVEKVRKTLNGKSTSKYERSFRIELEAGTGPWDIRLRRITPDATAATLQDKIVWSSYAEIEDVKLTYPNSALVAMRVKSSQFSSIPNRAYDMKLLKVKVPTNYDPITRAYDGTWDGTFKIAWTDNPAWVFYDLVTSTRYGLGTFVPEDQVDKWTLYTVGRYCDELVPDGFGDLEPRFTCNLYLQSRAEAYKVINDIASIFRGMVYWAGGALTTSQDSPSDATYLFGPANVIEGLFTYSGASAKSRHTVALVTWNDPKDFYRQKVEYVEDAEAIARLGAIETQVVAIGCVSRGQAHRLGRWLLYTERYQSETVAFQTGLEGAVCKPGQVIKVSDPTRAGKRTAGRIVSADAFTLTLDSSPNFLTDSAPLISVLMSDGTVVERTVTEISGPLISVFPGFDTPPEINALWLMQDSEVEPQLFRVISVLESAAGTFDVTAVSHNVGKFDAIDNGTNLEVRPISNLNVTPAAPQDLKITETLYAVGKDVRVKVTCSWAPSSGASTYIAQYQRDSQNYVLLPEATANEVEVLNAEPGEYTFSVIAISPTGLRSIPSSITKKVLGRGAEPGSVEEFSLVPNAGMAYLSWRAAEDLDVLIGGTIRIRFSPDVLTPLWKNSVDILPALPGTETRAQVPLLAGSYLAKFIDSSGISSAEEAIIITTIPTAQNANAVATIIEDPTFAGYKLGMEYRPDLGGLALAAGLPIDSVPDIDSIPSFDYAGGVEQFGEYYFDQTVELDDVYTSRVTVGIKVLAMDVADTIDQRDNDIDTWQDIDGDRIDDVNAVIFMRTTEDDTTDPGALWTEWKPFFVSEYRARGFQFKVEVRSGSAYHSLSIQQMRVTVDMPDRTENLDGLTTTTALLHVDYAAPFKAVPAIGIAAHNMNSGDYYVIANKTISGFDITFKNSAGAPVARTFDVLAKGYGRADA